MKEVEGELSRREIEALHSLMKEATPPNFLEQRVVEALKEARLIRSSRLGQQPLIRIGWALAASFILFFFGVVAGAWWKSTPSASNGLPKFMLVLRSSRDLSNHSAEEVMQTVKEYSAWARKMREEGVLVDGEKLKNEARFMNRNEGRTIVSEAPVESNAMAGYFLIRVRDYQQAITVAEGCPHLKYGGTIEIRQIDSTGQQSN